MVNVLTVHTRSQVRFRVLAPVAVACWAAAATLAPQFCADNTVVWLGLTNGRCVAAAMALQVLSLQPFPRRQLTPAPPASGPSCVDSSQTRLLLTS
jgi:hypothetical protein